MSSSFFKYLNYLLHVLRLSSFLWLIQVSTDWLFVLCRCLIGRYCCFFDVNWTFSHGFFFVFQDHPSSATVFPDGLQHMERFEAVHRQGNMNKKIPAFSVVCAWWIPLSMFLQIKIFFAINAWIKLNSNDFSGKFDTKRKRNNPVCSSCNYTVSTFAREWKLLHW